MDLDDASTCVCWHAMGSQFASPTGVVPLSGEERKWRRSHRVLKYENAFDGGEIFLLTRA